MRKYAVIPRMLAVCALAAGAGAETSDHLWLQASYEVLQFDRAHETPGRQGDISWSRGELLRRVLEKTEKGDNGPLIEGWITSTIYGRLYWDREVYLTFAPKLNTPLAAVCRVIVTGLPNSAAQPQGFAVGNGRDWCSEPGRADVVPTVAQVRAKWPRGRVGDSAVFRTSQGMTVTVRHVVGLNQYSTPLPPADVANILTIGLLPTTLEGARRKDRTLKVARLADARWGLALKYEPTWMNLSGCFLTTANQASVPSEGWITPEIEKWCRDHVARYFASVPLDQRPTPPVVMGQPSKSWAEDW